MAALALLSRIDLRLVLAGLLVVALGGGWALLRHKDAQLTAARVDLAVAEANVRALTESIETQNAAIEATAAAGMARQAAAQRAISNARPPRERVTATMVEPPRGSTLTERVEDVDRRLLESLR